MNDIYLRCSHRLEQISLNDGNGTALGVDYSQMLTLLIRCSSRHRKLYHYGNISEAEAPSDDVLLIDCKQIFVSQKRFPETSFIVIVQTVAVKRSISQFFLIYEDIIYS